MKKLFLIATIILIAGCGKQKDANDWRREGYAFGWQDGYRAGLVNYCDKKDSGNHYDLYRRDSLIYEILDIRHMR